MNHALRTRRCALTLTLFTLVLAISTGAGESDEMKKTGLVRCATLIFGNEQIAQCLSDRFLADVQKETNIWVEEKFTQVRLESDEIFQFPFAMMSGEEAFRFTDEQAQNLQRYLRGGGFLVVSAGCSTKPFHKSLKGEIARVFPDVELKKLELTHPIFHSLYDIEEMKTKKRGVVAVLYALEFDGRVALVYSPEGLNDTENAGGDCCCCGGNEVLNARQINANLLVYAVTH